MLYHRFLPLLLLGWFTCVGCYSSSEKTVVVYCALDREFAESILADFTTETGIRVNPRFDTEATKSVGLYQELRREKDQPRCDVHWNNEILATIRLQKAGILQPYKSPSADAIPEQFRDKEGYWCAFASRARILIVNTEKLNKADWPKSLEDLAHSRYRGQVAMAKPEFGTTASHAACLFEVWGEAKAKSFYQALAANDVKVMGGNKDVAVAVGQGRYAIGMTDTDDAMSEVRAGRPVQIIFPEKADGKTQTLFLPNTVALIRDCPNPEAGQQLIDYLLSQTVEEKLARSNSHQIPLNPKAQISWHPQMRAAISLQGVQVDFHRAADRWNEVQAFLQSVFAR